MQFSPKPTLPFANYPSAARVLAVLVSQLWPDLGRLWHIESKISGYPYVRRSQLLDPAPAMPATAPGPRLKVGLICTCRHGGACGRMNPPAARALAAAPSGGPRRGRVSGHADSSAASCRPGPDLRRRARRRAPGGAARRGRRSVRPPPSRRRSHARPAAEPGCAAGAVRHRPFRHGRYHRIRGIARLPADRRGDAVAGRRPAQHEPASAARLPPADQPAVHPAGRRGDPAGGASYRGRPGRVAGGPGHRGCADRVRGAVHGRRGVPGDGGSAP